MNPRPPESIVDQWGAWLIAAIVSAFTLGYACAVDNRAVMFLTTITAAYSIIECVHLHRVEIHEVRRRAVAAAKRAGR